MKTARRIRLNLSGFALVPALFLLVVLGAMGLIAVRVGTGQEQAVVMGLMQARALSAANSGIEWAAYQAFKTGSSCAASTTLTLTEASLAGFTVLVTCVDTTFSTDGGTTTNNSYVLTSVATSGTYGQPGYVRRRVSATFTDATP